MKFCLIVGTRPQIIKTQPIIHELISRKKSFSVIHTGQHYDYEMSRAFFTELKISKPNYNLGISKGTNSSQLADMLKKLEKTLTKIKPDVVIVPGDTRSALAGALALGACPACKTAFHCQYPLSSLTESMFTESPFCQV